MKYCLAGVLFALAGWSTGASAATLDQIHAMARAGATALALQQLDAAQPDPAADIPTWEHWETERIRVLGLRGDWQDLAARLATLPAGLDPQFLLWAETRRAEALVRLDQGAAARAVLRPLIWQHADSPTALQHWRWLLVRSYLADQRLDDARQAVQHLGRDYPDSRADTSLLEARLALRAGDPVTAASLLQDDKRPAARGLALLAQLRTRPDSAAQVLEKAVRLAVEKQADAATRRLAWTLAAQAARTAGSRQAEISALEHALVIDADAPDGGPVIRPDPDRLWDAYLALGEALGNAEQLVVGDDQAWFVAASNKFDSAPIEARALFAVVAFHALRPEQREVAHGQFAALLAKSRHGEAVLNALYLQSSRFDGVTAIPPQVRYHLADYALANDRLPLASRLMADLSRPPEGVDPAAWQLRRARVLLLGGRTDAALAALDAYFAAGPPTDIDRPLQVVFDLQTLDRHQAALKYLQQLYALPDLPDQRRRELLFWMADSRKGLKDYAQAAALYLQSATLTDPVAMDPWAQTARYQAAQALVKAGYKRDARALYQGLLNATQDEARKAVLRRDIQKLQLGDSDAGA